MAEGLSLGPFFTGLGRGSRNHVDPEGVLSSQAQGGQASLTPESSVSNSTFPGDILDLGNLEADLQNFGIPSDFQLQPNGVYRFSRFAASATVDLSLEQTRFETTREDGTSVLASLTELNISISVSTELERAFIRTGRERPGNASQEFPETARAVVDRFVARRIQATLNFDLSFSRTRLSFTNAGEGLGDLSALEADGTLGGFITLLETFFGDDEGFEEFIENLEDFLESFQGRDLSESIEVEQPSAGAAIETTRLDVSLDLSFESTQLRASVGAPGAEASDPLVLDLDGDGIELTSAEEGVEFDLDADGVAERTATVSSGDGFLVLDRNANGKVDDGRELFGDQNGARNGFEELSRFDGNRDGVIDFRDRIFNELKVFVDANRDGVSQSGELFTLHQAGIASINLNARDVFERASGGNRIAQRSFFTRLDGSVGEAADALLNRIV